MSHYRLVDYATQVYQLAVACLIAALGRGQVPHWARRCLSTVYCRYHCAVDVLAGVAALVPAAEWLHQRLPRCPAPPRCTEAS